MKLSELKIKVDTAIEKLGDMEVVVSLRRDETCSDCGQPTDRSCESSTLSSEAMGSSDDHKFWIEGPVD